jgi:pimeloyl-ACP methyl ester carboxylesterase
MKLFLFFLNVYFNSLGLLFPKNSVKRLVKLFSTPRETVVRTKEIEVLKLAKKDFIQTSNYKIATYEWGEGEDFAILCHGWESNAGSLGALVEILNNKGLRVLAFDGPAHGASNGKQASLIQFKLVFLELIKQIGMPKIAIGHSLGANAIMLAASEENLNIDQTILFAPVNKVSKVFNDFKELLNIPPKLFYGVLDHLQSQTGYLLSNLNFEDIAPKTSLRDVLILHDQKDQITPVDHSIDISNNWKKSKFIPINGSGHYKILWNEYALKEVESHLLTFGTKLVNSH